jgi:hypothetical protein
VQWISLLVSGPKYLAFLEAPPLDRTHQFVMNNIAKGYPQFVAVAGGGAM